MECQFGNVHYMVGIQFIFKIYSGSYYNFLDISLGTLPDKPETRNVSFHTINICL